MYSIPHCPHFCYDAIRFKFKLFIICVLLHSKLNFRLILQGGLAPCLIFGCDVPRYNPSPARKSTVPTEIFSLNLPTARFFHEEHCKGAWLASHVFDAHTYNPSQKKKKEKKKTMFFCLCSCYCLFHESLCFVVPLCFCIYTSTFYIYLYIFFI